MAVAKMNNKKLDNGVQLLTYIVFSVAEKRWVKMFPTSEEADALIEKLIDLKLIYFNPKENRLMATKEGRLGLVIGEDENVL